MTDTEEKVEHRYFNVERFRRVQLETSRPMGTWGRYFRRVTGLFDSMQGFFLALSSIPIVFGSLVAVVVGARYGPFVFLGIIGAIIGGTGYFVEKKVGKSIRVEDHDILLRTLGTAIAFLAIIGVIYLIIAISRLPLPFHV